jgi:hypothetical protein
MLGHAAHHDLIGPARHAHRRFARQAFPQRRLGIDLRARLTTDAEGNVARVEAAAGRFDTEAELLELTQDVRVIATGYSVDLQSARIDFQTGNVASPDPVRVEFEAGTIEADGMNSHCS